MAIAGIFEVLIVLFFFTGGGIGIPVGTPPAPEDALMSKIAPDDCVLYASWAGRAPIDPENNATERWLAQPELQKFFTLLMSDFENSIITRQGGPAEEAAATFGLSMLKCVLREPGAVYVSKFNFLDEDNFTLEAGATFHWGEQAESLKSEWEALIAQSPPEMLQDKRPVNIGGRAFEIVPIPDVEFSIVWGVHDGYFWLATSKTAMGELLANAETDMPDWLADVRERLAVPRISSVSYINAQKLLPLLDHLADPVATQLVDELGLNQLSFMASINGLNDRGFVTKTAIDINGEPKGLLELLGGAPIRQADLKQVDPEAMFVTSLRVSPAQVYSSILDIVERTGGREEFDAQIAKLEKMTGLSWENEVVDSLGDLVTVYGSVDRMDPFGKWVAAVQIDNEMVFQGAYQKLNDFAANMADQFGYKFEPLEENGQEVYSIQMMREFGPAIEPSWTLKQDELVFSFSARSVTQHLNRDGSDPANHVARQSPMSILFEESDGERIGPVALGQVDLAELIELYVSAIMGFIPEDQPIAGGELTFDDIPSVAVLTKGVQPSVVGLYRTPSGFLFHHEQTYPNGNPIVSLGVGAAMFIPTAHVTEIATQRTHQANNIRQLLLASHNYHDANGALPPAFTTDEDGKPLLSWRVLILPYLGHQALYEEFRLDEPWDSEHNRALLKKMPDVFKSLPDELEEGETTFLAAVGDDALFGPPAADQRGEETPLGTDLADVTDGTSETVAIVQGNADSAVPWTAPRDLDCDAEDFVEKLKDVYPGGTNIALADGSTHFIEPESKLDVLKKMLTVSGGEVVDWSDLRN